MNIKSLTLLSSLVVLGSLFSQTTEQQGYLDFNLNESSDSKDEHEVIIDPKHKTLLSAEIQSPVSAIHKKMGDSFKKGDILIQLNDIVYQSNIKKARAVTERAKVELEAKKQLFNENVASLFELKEAEANVAIAEAELAIAQRDLESTQIIAPYDGKVVFIAVEEYELPQPGTNLIEIVYDKVLIAKLLIPTSMLNDVKVGKTFRIEVPEAKKTLNAKISRVSSVIDPSSSTFLIEAEIPNEDESLLAGMKGIAHFKDVQSNDVGNIKK